MRYLERVVLDGGPLDGLRVEAEISRLAKGLQFGLPGERAQAWDTTTYLPELDSWGLPLRSERGDIHLHAQDLVVLAC